MLIHIIASAFMLSLVVGLLGKNRKFGFWGYFLGSLLMTPLIGLLMVLASDKQTNTENQHDEIKKKTA